MRILAALKLSVALWALAVATLPAAAHATVVWTGTLEKGNLSEWNGPIINPTKKLADGTVRNNVEFPGDIVHGGTKSLKVTVHPDDTFANGQDRVDIGHNSTLTAEGQDSYLSGWYYLVEDCKTRDEIIFYETSGSFHNWMDVWLEPKAGGGSTIKLGIENLGAVLIWTGTISAGQWHQLAIHVHWSMDPTKGQVDFWVDGQQVVTGFKHKTRIDGNPFFFQTGIHRITDQNFTETIYADDFIEADSQDEIKIVASSPSGDGGAPDAGMKTDPADGASGSGGASGAGGAGMGSGGGAGASGTGGASPSGSGGASAPGGPTPQTVSSGCAILLATDQPAPLGPAVVGAVLGAFCLATRRRRSTRPVAQPQ